MQKDNALRVVLDTVQRTKQHPRQRLSAAVATLLPDAADPLAPPPLDEPADHNKKPKKDKTKRKKLLPPNLEIGQ